MLVKVGKSILVWNDDKLFLIERWCNVKNWCNIEVFLRIYFACNFDVEKNLIWISLVFESSGLLVVRVEH